MAPTARAGKTAGNGSPEISQDQHEQGRGHQQAAAEDHGETRKPRQHARDAPAGQRLVLHQRLAISAVASGDRP